MDPATIPPGQDINTVEISTKSCEEICLTGEICPELLTVDCDNFKRGDCDCLTVCKKKLDLLQAFGHKPVVPKPIKVY